jgi:hypothetical protein
MSYLRLTLRIMYKWSGKKNDYGAVAKSQKIV